MEIPICSFPSRSQHRGHESFSSSPTRNSSTRHFQHSQKWLPPSDELHARISFDHNTRIFCNRSSSISEFYSWVWGNCNMDLFTCSGLSDPEEIYSWILEPHTFGFLSQKTLLFQFRCFQKLVGENQIFSVKYLTSSHILRFIWFTQYISW